MNQTQRKTILMGWEWGEGLGHIVGLTRLAKELSAEGHRVVFVCQDVVGPRAVFGDAYPVLAAPMWMRPIPLSARPFGVTSYSDLLAINGFARPGELADMVAAWDAILDLVKPDLVVADHSPTLILAALGRIPTVVVGYGFTLPPRHLPEFPSLRPDRPPLMPQAQVFSSICSVLEGRGVTPPRTFPQFLAGSVSALCCLPQVDHYLSWRREAHLGPLEGIGKLHPLPKEPHVFAYLAGDFEPLPEIVLALARLKCKVSVYMRGSLASHAKFLESRGKTVFEKPADLAALLPDVSVVISHGGIGTVQQALAAGRPQYLLPQHYEASLTSDALVKSGLALRPDHGLDAETVLEKLQLLIEDEALREAAQSAAEACQDLRANDAASLVLGACRRLLSAP